MKTKTLLELLTLSTSIYYIAKEEHLMDRLNELSEKGKDRINDAFSKPELDEEGNELELMDKVILKASQLKEELEQKIEELITQFYKKINVAHLDEIKDLNEKLDKTNTSIALIEARLNHLETKM